MGHESFRVHLELATVDLDDGHAFPSWAKV